MHTVTVRLIKPLKDTTITYTGRLLQRADGYALLLAEWTRPAVDLGFVVFEPGDRLYEHFYADRWYNVYELQSAAGQLKGWYCNVTRPAVFDGDTIESEDLELDLFVAADRATMLVLDEEEYAARNLAASDPPAHAAALAALAELRSLATAGVGPFKPSVLEGLQPHVH